VEVKSFRDLIAWQKAMDLVVEIYRATASFPRDERFGLTAQLRRCSVSIPSNIAEGHGRSGTREFLNFLSVAYGSLNEVQTQIMLAERVGFLLPECSVQLLDQCSEVARIVNGLRASLQAKLANPNP
jgi:four helix bundle protein